MAAHPTVAADTAELVVRDAADEVVGTVVGRAVHAATTSGLAGETMLWVARPIAGMSILLLVGDDALSETKELVPLFYESDDCSGSALLDAPPEADGMRRQSSSTRASSGRPDAERAVSSGPREPSSGSRQTAPLCWSRRSSAARQWEGGETRVTAPITGLQLADLHLRIPFRLEQRTAAIE